MKGKCAGATQRPPPLSPFPLEEPQGSLSPTEPPLDDFAQPPVLEEFDQRCGTIAYAE